MFGVATGFKGLPAGAFVGTDADSLNLSSFLTLTYRFRAHAHVLLPSPQFGCRHQEFLDFVSAAEMCRYPAASLSPSADTLSQCLAYRSPYFAHQVSVWAARRLRPLMPVSPLGASPRTVFGVTSALECPTASTCMNHDSATFANGEQLVG
jgi:hypothetical protein